MRSQTTNICGPYFLIVPNDYGCNYKNVSFLALASVVWTVDDIVNTVAITAIQAQAVPAGTPSPYAQQ